MPKTHKKIHQNTWS